MLRVIPRHAVNLNKQILKTVFNCILVGRNDIDYITRFEDKFAEYIGTKYSIGVSSAGTGLYAFLKALDFNENDEIILATYNFHVIPKILMHFRLKPVFVDINPFTYNFDVSLIEKKITVKTKAIIVVHLFGHPCDMDKILGIAKKYKLKIIEDCAHACGAQYKNKKVGTFGDASIFSFGYGKNMPCCGGGMVSTNDRDLAQKIKSLIDNADKISSAAAFMQKNVRSILAFFLTRRPVYAFTIFPLLYFFNLFNSDLLDRYLSRDISMINDTYFDNLRITNMQALIGLFQLARIDSINNTLIQNAEFISHNLENINCIKLPVRSPGTKHIYLYYRIQVPNRSYFRKELLRHGIDTQYEWLSAYSNNILVDNENENAKFVHKHSLQIPNHIFLSKADILHICNTIKNISKKYC